MNKNKWQTVSLSEIADYKTGKLNSNAAVENGKYPFFTCSRETFKINTWSFDCECVLLAGNNANAEYPVKYFKGKFDAYQRTYVITTKDPKILNIRFLYFVIELKLNLLKSLSTGAATRFLTKGVIDNLQIDLPSIEEQEEIVKILGSYDDIIENNTRRIAILETMAQNLYREWFVNFRFPGHEQSQWKDTPQGKIPVGWEIKSIEECYRTSSGGTPSRKISEYYGDDHDWIKTKELRDSFILETEEKISDLGLAKSSAKLFPRHTTIIAMYGATIGRLGITTDEAATNQACCALLPLEDVYSPWFIYLTLKEKKPEILALGQGAAQQNISQQVIKGFKFLAPEESLLMLFNERVEPLFLQMENLLKKNNNLKQQRDLLLPKLLSTGV